MAPDVLIVHDSAAIRKILQRVPRQADVPIGQVREAGGGREALTVPSGNTFPGSRSILPLRIRFFAGCREVPMRAFHDVHVRKANALRNLIPALLALVILFSIPACAQSPYPKPGEWRTFTFWKYTYSFNYLQTFDRDSDLNGESAEFPPVLKNNYAAPGNSWLNIGEFSFPGLPRQLPAMQKAEVGYFVAPDPGVEWRAQARGTVVQSSTGQDPRYALLTGSDGNGSPPNCVARFDASPVLQFDLKLPPGCTQKNFALYPLDGFDTIQIRFGLSLRNTFSVSVTLIYKMDPPAAAPGDPRDQVPGKATKRPDKPGEVYFAADTGPHLDTSCRFRSGGALEFDIPVTRYLADPALGIQQLIDNRVVGRTAKLRIMAFDVDSQAADTGTAKKESDMVYLNGNYVGTLAGSSGQWSSTELNVPIQTVKFPEILDSINAPAPALNRVRIEIDQANDQDTWCTAVDWASLSIRAAAPLILIHGTNASAATWEIKVDGASPVDWLTESAIPFFHQINLEPNGSFEQNAKMLEPILLNEARRRGIQSMHLIAHSKGASDARSYLHKFYRHGSPLKVLSLYSMGAPSQGTILSDLAVEVEKIKAFTVREFGPGLAESNLLFVKAFANADLGNLLGDIAVLSPVDPARELQRISRMRDFNNATPKHPNVPCFSIAGDADANRDGIISTSEVALVLDVPSWLPRSPNLAIRKTVGPMIYEALGRVRSIMAAPAPASLFYPPSWYWSTLSTLTSGSRVLLSGFVSKRVLPNDLVSTVNSVHCARCGFQKIPYTDPATGTSLDSFPANHSQLKSAAVFRVIWEHIQQRFPIADEGGK